jgi:hypothetical protein
MTSRCSPSPDRRPYEQAEHPCTKCFPVFLVATVPIIGLRNRLFNVVQDLVNDKPGGGHSRYHAGRCAAKTVRPMF